MQWVYRANTSNRECLVELAANNNLMLLENPKGAASFTSGRWNTGANPDLAFSSARADNRLPHLQVSASAARQAHGKYDHGALHKLQLHPHH